MAGQALPGAVEQLDAIRSGYTFDAAALELGAALDGESAHADAPVRVPLSTLNRHGLVAGATGTGKTKTLQAMAEQLSAQGVPVFLADIKGDLSGLAEPGEDNPKVAERAASVGQEWTPTANPVEFLSLGGQGKGVPIRATVTSFGPTLLSKVLGLNATQESSLGLVFHYADAHGLALLDLKDLREVIMFLTSDEGKDELKAIGGLSKQTAGVILRELTTFANQGADVFFGEPEFDTAELLRTAQDGRGIISCLELADVQDRPQLFSTFLMWLLADLFQDLPEVGDADKPKLVFFFDEAHLLFNDASTEFLDSIEQTVRLIRSKGVGIFFVTQSPKDVPAAFWLNWVIACSTPCARSPRTMPRPSRLPHAPTPRLVRPGRVTDPARYRRGRGHGAVRERLAHSGRVDPHACTAVADVPGIRDHGGRGHLGVTAQRQVRGGSGPRVRLRTVAGPHGARGGSGIGGPARFRRSAAGAARCAPPRGSATRGSAPVPRLG